MISSKEIQFCFEDFIVNTRKLPPKLGLEDFTVQLKLGILRDVVKG